MGYASAGTISPAAGSNTSAGTCSSGNSSEMWNDGTSGKFNGSLGFDGSDDTVSVTDPGTASAFDFASGDTITFSGWINPTSMPASDAFATILSKNNGAGNGYFVQYQGNGALEFCYQGSGGIRCYTTASTPVSAGSWQHIAFKFTYGSHSSATFYYNGKAQTGSWSGGSEITPWQDDSSVVIGADGSGLGEYVNGLIDDIRIYRYPLSTQQINDVRNAGAVRFGP